MPRRPSRVEKSVGNSTVLGVWPLTWLGVAGSLEVRVLEIGTGGRPAFHPHLNEVTVRSEMACEEFDRLQREHGQAVKQWKELLKQLSEVAQSQEPDFFRKAWQMASEAQQECATARAALTAHLEAHRCA